MINKSKPEQINGLCAYRSGNAKSSFSLARPRPLAGPFHKETARSFRPATERDAEERVISEAWEAPSEAAILLKKIRRRRNKGQGIPPSPRSYMRDGIGP